MWVPSEEQLFMLWLFLLLGEEMKLKCYHHDTAFSEHILFARHCSQALYSNKLTQCPLQPYQVDAIIHLIVAVENMSSLTGSSKAGIQTQAVPPLGQCS